MIDIIELEGKQDNLCRKLNKNLKVNIARRLILCATQKKVFVPIAFKLCELKKSNKNNYRRIVSKNVVIYEPRKTRIENDQ